MFVAQNSEPLASTKLRAMGSGNDIWQLLRNYWPVLLGNTLEWYEFAVYGPLVSGKSVRIGRAIYQETT